MHCPDDPDDPDGIFDDIFGDETDQNLVRSDEESPLISSGVSSLGKKCSPVVDEAIPVKLPCPRDKCKKTYKTETGLKNHLFVHRMQDVNISKPTSEEVFPQISGFLKTILHEMLKEPNSVEAKHSVVREMLKAEDSAEWLELISLLSNLITHSLAKRTKLLPSNQYEEFQTHILFSLNDTETFCNLKATASRLFASENVVTFIGNIVFRLCIRLGELIQSFLISKMKQVRADSNVSVNPVMSEQEESAFKKHLKKFLQNYFLRAVSIKNEVWEARSLCIRNRFIVNIEGDPVSGQDILNDSKWEDKELVLSDYAFNFFKGIEIIIRFVGQTTGSYKLENVLEKLIDNSGLLMDFHYLTTGYLGEKDTLSFLREMVQLFYTLSIRIEQKHILETERAKLSLAKFALRDVLKTNAKRKRKSNVSDQADPVPTTVQKLPKSSTKSKSSAPAVSHKSKCVKTNKGDEKSNCNAAPVSSKSKNDRTSKVDAKSNAETPTVSKKSKNDKANKVDAKSNAKAPAVSKKSKNDKANKVDAKSNAKAPAVSKKSKNDKANK